MWRRYEVIGQMASLSVCEHALEFGCGLGLFLPHLARPGCRAFAIELFPEYAKALCRDLNIDVTFLDSLDPLSENSLDLIVAADVLEHVEPLEELVKGFHARLKPGGRLIVSGPTENISYRLGRFVAGFAGKGHYHRTNIGRINLLIQESGFTLQHQKKLPFRFAPALFQITCFSKTSTDARGG